MRFIRDDVRVRDLDKRYKNSMRRYATRVIRTCGAAYSWNIALMIPLWETRAVVEKVLLKGA